jgi:hypothetical protein
MLPITQTVFAAVLVSDASFGRFFCFTSRTPRKGSAMNTNPKSPRILMRNKWFMQNLQLARDGDEGYEAAVSVLRNEFDVDFEKEGGRYVD